MKRWFVRAIAIALVIVGVIMVNSQRKEEDVVEGIAQKVIRLHVVGNSNTELDQSMKLKVKDKIVKKLQKDLKNVTKRENARELIIQELPDIEKTAKEEMKRLGYNMEAEAKVVWMDFPVKQYGDLTFPAGNYEALRVELGEAKGRNWWCVMYPSLCVLDSTYQVVPGKSKEQLKDSLTEEEYNAIVSGKEPVSFGFKFFDWVDNLLDLE